MMRVPLFDLKFLNELAAPVAGTSNRRPSRIFADPRRANEQAKPGIWPFAAPRQRL